MIAAKKYIILLLLCAFFIKKTNGFPDLQKDFTLQNNNYIEFQYKGHLFKFFDGNKTHNAVRFVADEIRCNHYFFDSFSAFPVDVMIDIGAHVGMISILYAKLYPDLIIYAFEPSPINYRCLLKNIEINDVRNIIPHNVAITKDGRDCALVVPDINSGMGRTSSEGEKIYAWPSGPCLFKYNGRPVSGSKCIVKSITLDSIFNRYKINLCKILKIDCEGAEFEILYNSKSLDKIRYLCGEFHGGLASGKYVKFKNGCLYSVEALIDFCIDHNIKIKVQKQPGYVLIEYV